jgi:hypothetical protein
MDYPSTMPHATNESSQSHTITLRRADGVPLGIDFSEQGQHLKVESVATQGAVEAWNRQCQMSSRQILPGDQILAVNLANDPETMRTEVSQKLLLKLEVRRGPRHYEESCQWVPQFFSPVVLMPGFIAAPPCGYNATACVEEKPSAREEEACHHEWFPDVKKFSGKHTKVTKTENLPLGEFAFMIHAHAISSERGGSSFQASDGKGTIHIKCNSGVLGLCAVQVTVGGESHTYTHNFLKDSICKIPKVFNFKSEFEAKGNVTVAFDFSVMR